MIITPENFAKATPEEYLEFYFSLFGNFRAMRFYNKPQPWFIVDKDVIEKIKKKEHVGEGIIQLPNQRQRMPNELILDIDIPEEIKDEKVGLNVAKEIFKRLSDIGIKSSLWSSGGRGYHLHAFFKDLPHYSRIERQMIRDIFVKTYLKDFTDRSKPHICAGKAVLIQLENAIHRRLKKFKTFVQGELFLDNEIPQEVLTKFIRTRNRIVLRIKRAPNIRGEDPLCIKFILSNDFIGKNDGRKRALFVLASYYKRKGLSEGEVLGRIREWNNYSLNGYLKDFQIVSSVRGANGSVTCRYVRSLLDELGSDICKGCNYQI